MNSNVNLRIHSLLITCLLLVFSGPYAAGQISSWYEPGIAVSSGLNFTGNMAAESAVWFRNSVRFTRWESSPLYICVNLGYAHRAYSLDYYSPLLESSSSGITYRNAFALQFGAEVRLKNIRKLRKVMHPFAGIYFQRQFYRLSDDDKLAREHFNLDGFKFAMNPFVFEAGSEFVSEKWPRFYFSFQIEPAPRAQSFGAQKTVTITNKQTSETTTVDAYYRLKELSCVRLFLGMRF